MQEMNTTTNTADAADALWEDYKATIDAVNDERARINQTRRKVVLLIQRIEKAWPALPERDKKLFDLLDDQLCELSGALIAADGKLGELIEKQED